MNGRASRVVVATMLCLVALAPLAAERYVAHAQLAPAPASLSNLRYELRATLEAHAPAAVQEAPTLKLRALLAPKAGNPPCFVSGAVFQNGFE